MKKIFKHLKDDWSTWLVYILLIVVGVRYAISENWQCLLWATAYATLFTCLNIGKLELKEAKRSLEYSRKRNWELFSDNVKLYCEKEELKINHSMEKFADKIHDECAQFKRRYEEERTQTKKKSKTRRPRKCQKQDSPTKKS